jgi:hypothetical protein
VQKGRGLGQTQMAVKQRDRVAQLMAIKKRSGRKGGRFPDTSDVDQLRELWLNSTESKEMIAALLPTRLVTLIEVFSRYWIERLVDHGSPYVERAVDLKLSTKIDLPLVHSLHGQTISLGLLISNSVPLSSIEAIVSVFSALLQGDFFDWLRQVRSRSSLEHDGHAAIPIIAGVDRMKRILARLFEVRHMLVHEFPEKLPFAIDEIDEMIETTSTFINAADEGFAQLLYGLWPLNQQAMNKLARDESRTVERELDRLVDEIAKDSGSDTIAKVHSAWRTFAESEAHRNAEGWEGGSGYPLIYHTGLKKLASDRLRQLQSWIDEFRENRE